MNSEDEKDFISKDEYKEDKILEKNITSKYHTEQDRLLKVRDAETVTYRNEQDRLALSRNSERDRDNANYRNEQDRIVISQNSERDRDNANYRNEQDRLNIARELQHDRDRDKLEERVYNLDIIFSRIDERVSSIQKDFQKMLETILSLNNTLTTSYVTRDSFWPVQKLTYGLVGLILTLVITGAVGLFIHRGF